MKHNVYLIAHTIILSKVCFLPLILYIFSYMLYGLETTSLVAQMVKHLSTMQETQVWALGWEDPLEKEMATHSSTIAWKIPWIEKPGRLQSMGSQRVGHNWAISLSRSCMYLTFLACPKLFSPCYFTDSLISYHFILCIPITLCFKESFYSTNFQPFPLVFNPFNPSQWPESSICILPNLYVIQQM